MMRAHKFSRYTPKMIIPFCERRLCSSSNLVYTLVKIALFYGLPIILMLEFYDVAIATGRLTLRIFSISRFSLRSGGYGIAFSAVLWCVCVCVYSFGSDRTLGVNVISQ